VGIQNEKALAHNQTDW